MLFLTTKYPEWWDLIKTSKPLKCLLLPLPEKTTRKPKQTKPKHNPTPVLPIAYNSPFLFPEVSTVKFSS